MKNIQPKITRTFSINETGEEYEQARISPLANSSLLNTMIQMKQGTTPKHNKTISDFSFKNAGSDTERIPEPCTISFDQKERSTSKTKARRITACFVNQNTSTKLSDKKEEISAPSYTENSESELGCNSYIQQSCITTATQKVKQLTFRNRGRKGSGNVSNKQNLTLVRSQSPPTTTFTKQSPIQFVPLKSPKFQNLKKQEGKMFSYKSNNSQYEEQLSKLNQTIKTLNKQKMNHLKWISELEFEVVRLREERKAQDVDFQIKQNVFFEQINQLVKDRKILEKRLSTLQSTPQRSFSSSNLSLQTILSRLNQKDLRIRELQTINHDQQTKIDLLMFEVENLRSRTNILNQSAVNAQNLIFQQAFRHLEKEVEKYKKKIQSKNSQTQKIKEELLIIVEEKECMANELEVEKLIRSKLSSPKVVEYVEEQGIASAFPNVEMNMVFQIFDK